jgi:hypothetical protein
MLRAAKLRTNAIQNAAAVCLMRIGRIDEAVGIVRGLSIPGDGFSLDPRAPTVFKANYATALLLAQRVNGCVGVLNQIADRSHPSVVKIRRAIEDWAKTLNPIRRFLLPIAGYPNTHVPLAGPPGDLWFGNAEGSTRSAA